tara:strand:+ start:603 stop:1043 length:441 start_codon:yes stop_codon:yes gene_type:complete
MTTKVEYEVGTAHWFRDKFQPILYYFDDRDEALACWRKNLVAQRESHYRHYADILVRTVIENHDEDEAYEYVENIDPWTELGISEEMVYIEEELKSLNNRRGFLLMAEDPDHEDEIGEIYKQIKTLQKKGGEILFGSTWVTEAEDA